MKHNWTYVFRSCKETVAIVVHVQQSPYVLTGDVRPSKIVSCTCASHKIFIKICTETIQSTHGQLWLRPIVWELDENNQLQCIYLLWRYAFRSDNLIANVCNKKVLGTLLVSYYFLIYDCWQFGVLNNRHRVYKTVGWTVTKRIFICIKFCIWLVHRILSWIFHANVSILF